MASPADDQGPRRRNTDRLKTRKSGIMACGWRGKWELNETIFVSLVTALQKASSIHMALNNQIDKII